MNDKTQKEIIFEQNTQTLKTCVLKYISENIDTIVGDIPELANDKSYDVMANTIKISHGYPSTEKVLLKFHADNIDAELIFYIHDILDDLCRFETELISIADLHISQSIRACFKKKGVLMVINMDFNLTHSSLGEYVLEEI